MKSKGLIAIVEDDARILRSLTSLLESVGYRVTVFASTPAILELDLPADTVCAILDVGLNGIKGSSLHQKFFDSRPSLPVILLTECKETKRLPDSDQTHRLEVFEKPFEGSHLVAAIEKLSLRVSERAPYLCNDR